MAIMLTINLEQGRFSLNQMPHKEFEGVRWALGAALLCVHPHSFAFSFIVTAMGLKPSPSGETFRFFR